MILVCLGLSTGCARLVMSQLDTLVVWYVDGYVDLDRDQERLVREAVNSNLAWFRREEMPRYVELLRAISRDVESPVSKELVSRRFDLTVALWDDLRVRLAPDAAALARTLTDAQVEEFFRALADDNRDLAREYSGSTAAERRQRQDRLILKNLRRMVGRLSREQEARILARTGGLHDLSEEWLDRRAAWQEALRQQLMERREPGFESGFRRLLLDTQQFDSPEYRRLADENRQQVFAMLADLANSFTPAQRRHFQRRLDEFARDIVALSVQSRDTRALPVTAEE